MRQLTINGSGFAIERAICVGVSVKAREDVGQRQLAFADVRAEGAGAEKKLEDGGVHGGRV